MASSYCFIRGECSIVHSAIPQPEVGFCVTIATDTCIGLVFSLFFLSVYLDFYEAQSLHTFVQSHNRGSEFLNQGVPSTKCSENISITSFGSYSVAFFLPLRFISQAQRSLCSEFRNLLGNQDNLKVCSHTHTWCEIPCIEKTALPTL